jgi:thymidylate synthase
MFKVTGDNFPRLYSELLWLFRTSAVEENSRNGPVKTLPGPLMVEVLDPTQRVITDRARNANPFFHVMEFVWMMAGRNDAEWISNFNSRMAEYAEEDGNYHGAYGFRWRHHFDGDQVDSVIKQLAADPDSRRAMIAMWDPNWDTFMGPKKDHPCNTHIYFRIRDKKLTMTVCNRSNDIVWGMTGANAVHMSLLQELMANALGIDVGSYYVMTNNAHMYPELLPNYEDIMRTYGPDDIYGYCDRHTPLLHSNESYDSFVDACIKFTNYPSEETGIIWIDRVAYPMLRAFLCKEEPLHSLEYCQQIIAQDWKMAALEWIFHNRLNRRG